MNFCPDCTFQFRFSSLERCYTIPESLTALVWKYPNFTPGCTCALPKEWFRLLFETVQLVFLSGNTSLFCCLFQYSAALDCRCRKIIKRDWHTSMQEGKLWNLRGVLWYISCELANTSAMELAYRCNNLRPAVWPVTCTAINRIWDQHSGRDGSTGEVKWIFFFNFFFISHFSVSLSKIAKHN